MVSRRDFLRLRGDRRQRIVEVSCERLHERWHEGRVPGDGASGVEPSTAVEPAAGPGPLTAAELFEELEDELLGAHVLRLVDRQWLSGADDELRRGLGDVISAFRARGGEVEYSSST